MVDFVWVFVMEGIGENYIFVTIASPLYTNFSKEGEDHSPQDRCMGIRVRLRPRYLISRGKSLLILFDFPRSGSKAASSARLWALPRLNACFHALNSISTGQRVLVRGDQKAVIVVQSNSTVKFDEFISEAG